MGIQPGEFWEMTLPEFFAEVYAAPAGGVDTKLTDDDRARFKSWLDGE
jgi:hypothetical protein